jgi:TetR/AcrR family transcriptional regulator, cholesterol catabolism regulator
MAANVSRMTPDSTASTPLREAPRGRGRPKKTVLERDDGNRRQHLLREAARLFRSQGFDATSTRDIAASAGMRSGSPFYHFENKEALLAAVMQEGMGRALRRQSEAMATAVQCAQARQRELTARECLHVLVRNHFDVLLGPESDFIPVMLYEWRSLSPGQRIEVNQLKDRYEAVWVPVLDALHASGELCGDVRLARLLIFGALNWTAQWFHPHERASLDDLTHAALRLFLKEPA